MKILVMGAGAVGAYFGARLQQSGHDVVFCARGDNLRALRSAGLSFASFQGDFTLAVTATAEPREFAPYDLILFCVKSYDTAAAASALAGCLAQGGAILTVQNGVENEAILAAALGRAAVLTGNARIGAELIAPGHIVHRTGGVIEFGELDGGDSARARHLAEVFRGAGIFGQLSLHVMAIRWEKLLWNAAFNTVATLTRRNVGALLDDPDAAALLRTLMNEIAAVATAEGFAQGDAEVEAQFTRSRASLREVRPSTLQDFERGKPLEYEALSGAVVRLARRHALATPHMDAVHALMRLLDGHRTKAAPPPA
ncbi:MAG TPA: ketopantoate reductase family protein [Candidatus Binataceae bacterium]|nr:ketopantoate reductase family protein [Candidatus Binataceae bacterium]